MNVYILSQKEDGRVVLDTISHGADLDSVQAKTWIEAREKIKDRNLWHNPGYGWFLR